MRQKLLMLSVVWVAGTGIGLSQALGAPGTITTLAGSNGAGQATSIAQAPMDVVVAGGAAYIADPIWNVVRKLDLETGAESVIAGNGSAGFSGDGGPATSAQLDTPRGLAVDQSGNLYVADTINNRVRRIDAATGVIDTIAGNGSYGFTGDGVAAIETALAWPHGLCFDPAGNLLIADRDNNRIRRVNLSTGLIETVAGSGVSGFAGDGAAATAAALAGPWDVDVDADANVFIADRLNHRIRKVDAATGTIDTIAGSGVQGFAGDGGPATAAQLDTPTSVAVRADGTIYVADLGNYRLRTVGAGGLIDTVAGDGTAGFGGDGGPPTSARLGGPYAVALDAAQRLYVADYDNNRVRRLDASVIETIAGTGGLGFSGDGGPALLAQFGAPTGPTNIARDATGRIYLADNDAHRVRRIELDGTITTVAGNGSRGFAGDGGPATAAQLDTPVDVIVDAVGNLVVADRNNHRLRFVDATSGVISTIAGNGTAGGAGDGGLATEAQLNLPSGLAYDPAGNLLVADTFNHRIRRIEAVSGVISTIAGTGTPGFGGDGASALTALLNFPTGVTVDAAGNIYVADRDNHRIRRIVAATGVIETVAGTGNPGAGGDGGLAIDAELQGPWSVDLDAVGDLLISDRLNHRVRKVMLGTGVITTFAGNGVPNYNGDFGLAVQASLNVPTGVLADDDNDVLIVDKFNRRIRRVEGDFDGDGVGNDSDLCPTTQPGEPVDSTGCFCDDQDADGVCDARDNCPGISNADQTDRDEDGSGNVCDWSCAADTRGSCVPGGRRSRTDCLLEYLVTTAVGASASTQFVCRDGDPQCDNDAAQGQCTFRVGLCLGVTDPRLLDCRPTAVAAVRWKKPTVNAARWEQKSAAQALLAALGAFAPSRQLAGGRGVAFESAVQPGDQCTELVSVVVPLRNGGHAGKLRLASVALGANGGRRIRDPDRLVLVCEP